MSTTLLASVSADVFSDANKVADDIARDLERAFGIRTFIEGDYPWFRVHSTNEAPNGAASYAKQLLADEKALEADRRARGERTAAERTERKRTRRAGVRPYGKRDV